MEKVMDRFKNDDSVKEAPAYCQSFLDIRERERGVFTINPYFNVS